MESAVWHVTHALPNLQGLKSSVSSTNLAIAPYSDQRVQLAMGASPAARKLLEGFTNIDGDKILPSALLMRDSAPSRCHSAEAVVAFRNCAALSCILAGWPQVTSGGAPMDLLWSDHFELYPVVPGREEYLIVAGPALVSYRTPGAPFHGQVHPYVAGNLMVPYFDQAVLRPLIELWESEFVTPGLETERGQRVFRSLQMAYHATAVPIRNLASVYDWGTAIGLWISAFEILVHPGNRSVRLSDVLESIGRIDWVTGRLRKRHFSAGSNKAMRVCLPQRLYYELYSGRNAFLHGNPIAPSMLYPFGREDAPPLTQIAPVLYRLLLISLLGKRPAAEGDPDSGGDYLKRLISQLSSEECLMRVFRDRAKHDPEE